MAGEPEESKDLANPGPRPVGRNALTSGDDDFLTLARDGPTFLLPFSNAVVPEVDLEGGRVVIAPPQEIEGAER